MHELLQQFREQFEFIFIDSSPVMAVSDAVFLSTMVEGTLLVVNRRTPKPLVRKTRHRLTTPHTKILGVLLNRVDIRAGEYGSYYRHYYEYYPHDHDTSHSAPPVNGNRNGALTHRANGHSSRPENDPEPTGRASAISEEKNEAVSQAINGNALTTSEPDTSEPRNERQARFLDAVNAKLIEAMGPMANVVLREYVLDLGE